MHASSRSRWMSPSLTPRKPARAWRQPGGEITNSRQTPFKLPLPPPSDAPKARNERDTRGHGAARPSARALRRARRTGVRGGRARRAAERAKCTSSRTSPAAARGPRLLTFNLRDLEGPREVLDLAHCVGPRLLLAPGARRAGASASEVGGRATVGSIGTLASADSARGRQGTALGAQAARVHAGCTALPGRRAAEGALLAREGARGPRPVARAGCFFAGRGAPATVTACAAAIRGAAPGSGPARSPPCLCPAREGSRLTGRGRGTPTRRGARREAGAARRRPSERVCVTSGC